MRKRKKNSLLEKAKRVSLALAQKGMEVTPGDLLARRQERIDLTRQALGVMNYPGWKSLGDTEVWLLAGLAQIFPDTVLAPGLLCPNIQVLSDGVASGSADISLRLHISSCARCAALGILTMMEKHG